MRDSFQNCVCGSLCGKMSVREGPCEEDGVKVSVLCVICVRVREKNEEGDEMNLVSVRLFSVGERGNLLKIERMVSCGGFQVLRDKPKGEKLSWL
ncbi:hypothetical protein COLO4_06043 [Corchorus olitorius]|uniref:Uncharacterized protein n=1 Tax=Corchorus olitorius TaxID=93759 RepID=A0A1R3KP45_9ROSI|nr:hypothetical protein COLO4_06043 [Corchorus olitorius]